MKFQRKPCTIDVRRATQEEILDTHHGPAVAIPGDWIVRQADGEEYPVRDARFRRLYIPADADACRAMSQRCTRCAGGRCPFQDAPADALRSAMDAEIERTCREDAAALGQEGGER